MIDNPDGSLSLRSVEWSKKEEVALHVGFTEDGKKKDPTKTLAHETHAKFDLIIIS